MKDPEGKIHGGRGVFAEKLATDLSTKKENVNTDKALTANTGDVDPPIVAKRDTDPVRTHHGRIGAEVESWGEKTNTAHSIDHLEKSDHHMFASVISEKTTVDDLDIAKVPAKVVVRGHEPVTD